MTTLTVSEETFNAFKEEQARKRKETGEKWDADKLVAYLLKESRKVNK